MKSEKAKRPRRSGSGKSARPSKGSGPKDGLYRKLFDKGALLNKPYSKLSELEKSRRHDLRAMQRRKDEGRKYEYLAVWVKDIRTKFKVGQAEFAEMLGVSTITVRRYECALGSYPSDATMKRLQELDRTKRKRGSHGR
jgi:DNA-binding transcriptional regulator YiaG